MLAPSGKARTNVRAREVHLRFCESGEVKVLTATRHAALDEKKANARKQRK